MEPKPQICCDQPPSLSSSYQSFIAQNLDSLNRHHRISKLHGRRIRACFHGWVILSDLPDGVLWSLWNPLIPKLIRLPPLIHKEKAPNYYCLSSPPDDPGSVFLFTIAKTPTIVFCRLDREKEGLEWTEMSYAKQLRSMGGVHGCFLENLTCCNGKVYAMTLVYAYNAMNDVDINPGHDLIALQVDINVVKGKDVVISLLPFVKLPYTCFNPFPTPKSVYRGYSFLKGSCTELFYIEIYYIHESRTADFNMFRLDMASMTWEEMEDLKDAVFVLEFGSGNTNLAFYRSKLVFSNIAGYVHFLSERDAIVSSFHIKDRTMSLSSMPSFVRESQLLVWTMLECGLEANHPKSNQQEVDKDNDIVVRPIKSDETRSNIATRESHLLNIPSHMLATVMELCVGIEYIKFRATCKHCSLAAPSIQWSNKLTTLRRLQMYSLASPWLMVLDNNRGIITFIDPLYGDRYFIKTSQELKGDYKICCSRFGWLLMYKKNAPLVFFNPFTSDNRELPMICQLESFCFSAPPTSPNCMVVGFAKLEWHVYIHIVHGESLWKAYQLNFGRNRPHSFQFPTFSGRDIYALCNNVRIEAFRNMNVEEDNYSWDVVVGKAPRSCCRYPAQYFLSMCDQHILLVIVGVYGESVEVFKLNDFTKEWEKIDNLGKHVIYISNTSCICHEAKSLEMENKIYFPRLRQSENGKIVFYSLETCRYHAFDDKNIQQSLGADLFITKHHWLPHTWIEPSWS